MISLASCRMPTIATNSLMKALGKASLSCRNPLSYRCHQLVVAIDHVVPDVVAGDFGGLDFLKFKRTHNTFGFRDEEDVLHAALFERACPVGVVVDDR